MIHEVCLGRGRYLRFKDHKIQKNTKPMNNFYWDYSDSINDKYIGMDNFKYVDYEDAPLVAIKIFKKDG